MRSRAYAPAMVLVHNHPSGDADPSEPDIHLTKEAAQAAKLLGIQLLDHIVIGQGTLVRFLTNRRPYPRICGVIMLGAMEVVGVIGELIVRKVWKRSKPPKSIYWTMTTPFIRGCRLQEYSNLPGLVKAEVKVAPGPMLPELKEPSPATTV